MLKHGGNIWEAERRIHKPFSQFLDFSSNINPLGPSAGVRDALQKSFKKIIHYPDPDYVCLRKALSCFLKVDVSSIFVGNGLSQVIDLVSRSYNFNETIIPNPTYSEYEHACLKSRIPVSRFAMREKANFNLDKKKFFKIIETKRESAIFFCNPNNPTGIFIYRRFFEALLKKISSKRNWLIVDEAFIDFAPYGRGNSLIPFTDTYPRLIVLWSLTKIFSIPGLRLGVVVANNKIIKRLQAIAPPWSVNLMAQEAAIVSLRDKTFLKRTETWIKKEKEYLFNTLKEFNSLKVYPTEANFFLIKISNKNISVRDLRNKLLNHRILIRDCSNFHFLDGSFFRIAIKDRASNRRLVFALKKYLN